MQIFFSETRRSSVNYCSPKPGLHIWRYFCKCIGYCKTSFLDFFQDYFSHTKRIHPQLLLKNLNSKFCVPFSVTGKLGGGGVRIYHYGVSSKYLIRKRLYKNLICMGYTVLLSPVISSSSIRRKKNPLISCDPIVKYASSRQHKKCHL